MQISGVLCSSVGIGAFTEIGPFKVKEDGKNLDFNQYAWNKEANILFAEFEIGIGFSYSNKTSDYQTNHFTTTVADTYAFFLNWLQRFPEYKNADVYLVGEGFSGAIAIHLGQFILQESQYELNINLKGIAARNVFIDKETDNNGFIDYAWSHSLTSDEIYMGIKSNCNFSAPKSSKKCDEYIDLMYNVTADINPYDIYSPLCNSTSEIDTYLLQGPCSSEYVSDYFNNPAVQIALHANLTDAVPYPWSLCNVTVGNWTDYPDTSLPIIAELMAEGIQIWIYNGDLDSATPINSFIIVFPLMFILISPSNFNHDSSFWDGVGLYDIEAHHDGELRFISE
ncbi:OLC1v1002466C1 [Oldenlandia corymbosa var. corymbosa]|uniref:OLC1v1002466C1 n=1 Tax=Oldenlandia corymbosa var. corymbosa TaxID=529605 RepID=A0AAV1DA63_OLDCO|nr:OLC1v1002466C1 [Oldenlandia corymbosa var. corymbosa]